MDIRLAVNGADVRARRDAPGRIHMVGASGEAHDVQVDRRADGAFLVSTPDGLLPAEAVRDGSCVWVRFRGRTYRFEIVRGTKRARVGPAGDLASPMPGQVQRLLVAAGETVAAQQPLLVVEAMKMQIEIKAPHAGRVARLLAAVGDRVDAGVPLVELEAAP